MGKVITFEGLDGSGKTTQIKNLKEYLESLGYSVLSVRQPGDTQLGEKLRDLIFETENIHSSAEIFLFLASQIQGIIEIKNKINSYDFILMDRSIISTLAYQCSQFPESDKVIEKLLQFRSLVLTDFKFDLLLFLESDPQSYSRATDQNKFERKGDEFFREVSLKYNHLFYNDYMKSLLFEHVSRAAVVVKKQPIQEVFKEIIQLVEEHLNVSKQG